MKVVKLGKNHREPAYFDMTGRFPAFPEAGPLRAGDRAAAYCRVLQWRQTRSDRKLVILDDTDFPDPAIKTANALSSRWLFKDLADEIWYDPDRPVGECLYNENLWTWWKKFNAGPKPRPNIAPAKFNPRLQWKLRPEFITVQPLWDAQYNTARNRPPEFWAAAVEQLTAFGHVVILGPQSHSDRLPKIPNTTPLWKNKLSMMDSLAVIKQAKLHVGGETGTTLWAPIIGTPTLALYAPKHLPDDWFTEPIGFDSPVKVIYNDDITEARHL